MVRQRKSRGYMHIPPPGMVRNPGPHFDQALDQPVDGPPHLFAPDVKLPDHMQEVIGQNPHLQPGLVGLEPLATGLVPPQSVLPFLDPVFHICPAVIDFDHLTGRQPGVGDHKTDPGKTRPGATRSWPPPAEAGSNSWPGSEGQDLKPDEISAPVFLAIIILDYAAVIDKN